MRIWHKISKVSDGRLCQLANDDECSLQEQPDDMMQEMDFFPADAVEQRAGRNPCHSGDNDGQHAAALDYGEQRICQKQQTSGFDTNGGGISWENAFFSREAGGVLLAGRGPSPGGVSSVAEVLPAASREVCFHRANSINMA